jgi:hypothetical protein
MTGISLASADAAAAAAAAAAIAGIAAAAAASSAATSAGTVSSGVNGANTVPSSSSTSTNYNIAVAAVANANAAVFTIYYDTVRPRANITLSLQESNTGVGSPLWATQSTLPVTVSFSEPVNSFNVDE